MNSLPFFRLSLEVTSIRTRWVRPGALLCDITTAKMHCPFIVGPALFTAFCLVSFHLLVTNFMREVLLNPKFTDQKMGEKALPDMQSCTKDPVSFPQFLFVKVEYS